MASGTIYFKESSASDNYITGKITWSSSTNKDANTSDVTVNLYVAKGHWDMMLTVPTTGTWGYKLTINGTSYSGYKSYLSVLEDWVLVYTQSVSGIKHDEGGGKSISLYGSVTAPSGTTLAGHTTSGSGTATFETIPRASTIDSLKCSTSYLDGTITAVYTPKNAAYFNKQIVYLNYNGVLTTLRTTNIGRNTAAQQSSIINLTGAELSKIYAKVTSATSAKIRVSFFTYSDGGYSAKIGDTQYKEITLTIPTGVKPKASLSASMINDNAWIKSKGIYVAGFSKTKLTLSAEAGEGASVASTSISGEGFSQAVTTVTAALAAAGRFTFTGKVTDTRGRSASDDAEITVLPYSPPIISALKVERGTYSSGWTASENGPDVRCYFITSLGLADQGNTYSVAFALDGNAKAPDVGNPEGLGSGIDYAFHFYAIDSEYSHTLKVTVTDLAGESRSATIVVPTTNATIEFKANGKGIAFGKTSEHDAFECAMDAEFNGSVKRIRSDGSEVLLDDTGWIDLGISDSVTESSSTTAGHYNGCAYRVVGGNHVYVAFNVRATYSGSAVTVSGTAIPSQYRPKLQPYAVVTLNGSRVARILVSRSNGHAIIDWIRNVSDDVEPPEHIATWIDGYIDYWLN